MSSERVESQYATNIIQYLPIIPGHVVQGGRSLNVRTPSLDVPCPERYQAQHCRLVNNKYSIS